MKRTRVLLLLLLSLGILIRVPASGFTAEYLDIVLDREGNATVTFEYTTSWVEGFLAFVGAVRPDRDLQAILAATTGGEVRTLSVGDGVTIFSVEDFALIREYAAGVSYETRTLNLTWGQEGYRSSLLSPLLSPDFSPQTAVVRFPDGYSVIFPDQLTIPGITHPC